MHVVEAIRARRNIKRFTDRRVAPETLEALLELAVLPPNHRMTEPWRFLILGDEAKRRFGEVLGGRRAKKVENPDAARLVVAKAVDGALGRPATVGFVQRLDDDPEIREEDYAAIFMGMENLMLGAVARGLGSGLQTGAVLDDPAVRDALGIHDGERLVALLHLGEADEVPPPKRRTVAAARTQRLA